MNEVKLSILRCKPYFADNSDCNVEEYGMRYPFECLLWRIFIDDECVAEEATPFLASSAVIEFGANKCVPIFGDGGDYVMVRLLNDKILWFGIHPRFRSTFDGSPLPANVIYVFNTAQYSQAVDQAEAALIQMKAAKQSESNPLRNFLNYLRGTPPKIEPIKPTVKPIPILTAKELREHLLTIIPYDFDLPLYRMPELADDQRGERLFRAVWDVISLQEIQVSEPPPTTLEVRIGLDKDVFVESVWQVGKVGDDLVILFVSEPRFPLWISGFQPIIPLLGDALDALGASKQDV